MTAAELTRAKAQLHAQLVFDNDSITNIAHQIGYFETIASANLFEELPTRIAAASLDEVGEAARQMLTVSNRTIGWFLPLEP